MHFIIKDDPNHGVRAYASPADRKRAIKALARTYGYDHFVCFCDVRGKYALQYGNKTWNKGTIYVSW